MKSFFYLFIFFGIIATEAQTDYNTKKGYAAEGYDVISYFENNPTEGNKQFSTSHDGVNYKFVSQAHLETFKKNPEKYMPAYGGYCAYAVAKKGKKVSIDPETYEIRDGKLYLFYNSWGTNTLELWLKNDVKGLQQKADQNWELINTKD